MEGCSLQSVVANRLAELHALCRGVAGIPAEQAEQSQVWQDQASWRLAFV